MSEEIQLCISALFRFLPFFAVIVLHANRSLCMGLDGTLTSIHEGVVQGLRVDAQQSKSPDKQSTWCVLPEIDRDDAEAEPALCSFKPRANDLSSSIVQFFRNIGV